MLNQQRKPFKRDSEGIVFNDPLWSNPMGGNWRALVMFDQGRIWIDGVPGARSLRYEIVSLHGFVFCCFGGVMFVVFGLTGEGVTGLRFGAAAFLWLYKGNAILAAIRVPLLFSRVATALP